MPETPLPRLAAALAALLVAIPLAASASPHAGGLDAAYGQARLQMSEARPIDTTAFLLGVHYQRLGQLRDQERRLLAGIAENRQEVERRLKSIRAAAVERCGNGRCGDLDPRQMSDERVIQKLLDADLALYYVFFPETSRHERELADLSRRLAVQRAELAGVQEEIKDVSARIAGLERRLKEKGTPSPRTS